MTSAPTIVQLGFRRWFATVFLAAIGFTVLAYGSASTVQANFAAIVFAGLAIVSTLHPIGSLRVGRVHAVAILLLAGLVGYAAFQTLPLAGLDLANGAWESINENIGPAPGTISVAPGMTLDALSSLALPFLVFISALVFFQGDDEALWLWRALLEDLGYCRQSVQGQSCDAQPPSWSRSSEEEVRRRRTRCSLARNSLKLEALA